MSSPISPDLSIDKLSGQLAGFFDAEWYRSRYPDIEAAGADPLYHFVTWGAAEGRDPNRWFDSAWYLEHYPDVAASGMVALLHYFQAGAAELRNPHPRFDAVWYVDQHPEATANPLLHYVTVGAAQGWLTEKPINMQEYLPSTAAPFAAPRGIAVDVIIPAYRGLKQTRRCVESVLADDERPEGRVIVVDDKSPEPALSAWLDRLAAEGRILLIRNSHNAGFVASVNRGIQAAGDHDVALLNSDTEVPQGWLRRLSAQAYAKQRIASVSPFSNNATICGYPTDEGGPLPLGMTVQQIDAACQSVNAGRAVSVPTTVGFCMYIRRAALNDVGLFDEAAFGLGYGEENDFCLRAAARGWRNILACDTFVYHEGNVSFGSSAAQITAKNGDVLLQRWPNYARLINQHIALDAVGPFRFAVTAALLRQSRLPVLLMVLHRLGGGVQQHIDMLMERLAGRTHVLVMQATARGAAISLPALSSQPVLTLPGERVTDLVTALQSANVSRAHIHHLMGMDVDVRELLHRLQVPFDVTVHDYFAICPQVNLVTSRQSHYCTEPVIAACNACIADQPSHGARDIVSWRRQFAWQFLEAERVICPSEDVKARLTRYGLAGRAIVARHEATPPRRWPMHLPALKGRRLRVAILGVLADGKGSQTVFSLAEHTSPAEVEFHVVGYAEQPVPDAVAGRITITGEYKREELSALLAKVKPHLVWFPAQWPETYSYTLTAAIEAGLPIVASGIGAFTERLRGRPMSWLVDPRAAPEEWLDAFRSVRSALREPRRRKTVPVRPAVPDFYLTDYLRPPAAAKPLGNIRRSGRISVVVIPERLENGALSPCAYIRLLQPLDHLAARTEIDFVVADAKEALHYRADIIATQRFAVPDAEAADKLAAHCRETGATLLYDLDDDLLRVPRGHPDANMLRGKVKIVQRLLRHADAVWVSTPALAESMAAVRRGVRVVPNGLDERLWCDLPPGRRSRQDPVRILCMGTATHAADFAMIQPALERLKEMFGERVAIDMLGVTMQPGLPDWINRLPISVNASGSYPGFVNWITQQPGWDIGIAPLADTEFNRCKSSIKTLDYAALGLAVVASDVEAYRGSLADGPGGMLSANTTSGWYEALSRLLRDRELRTKLARGARERFAAEGTLASQFAARRAALQALARKVPQPVAPVQKARRVLERV